MAEMFPLLNDYFIGNGVQHRRKGRCRRLHLRLVMCAYMDVCMCRGCVKDIFSSSNPSSYSPYQHLIDDQRVNDYDDEIDEKDEVQIWGYLHSVVSPRSVAPAAPNIGPQIFSARMRELREGQFVNFFCMCDR